MRHDFLYFCPSQMVAIAQLVRALDCGSKGRGFEPHWLPQNSFSLRQEGVFHLIDKLLTELIKYKPANSSAPFIKNPC